MSEARTEDRLGRLEAVLARLEPLIVRIDERLQHVADAAAVARIEAMFPHLATKAELISGLSDVRTEVSAVRVELADKPGRGYLWGVMAAMVGAQAVALAAAALIFSIVQARSPAAPHASIAPPCKDGRQAWQACKPWERDWSATQLPFGSTVTDQGIVFAPAASKP
jgi:hypothetical protein